jgi:error-prone DNA polymerase
MLEGSTAGQSTTTNPVRAELVEAQTLGKAPFDRLRANGFQASARGGNDRSVVRLGLHQIGGLGSEMGRRIAAVRPFKDVADLARRTELNRDALDRLAAAGALASLSGHRREAAWAVAAVPIQRDLLFEAPAIEVTAELPAPSEGENLVADFSTLSLTFGRHPLSLLRANLERRRYVTTSSLRDYDHNRPARCAGIVTGRQRPGTASGVIFLTLEDETGFANVIIHQQLSERQRREVLGSRLLGVLGIVQREGEVVHLIAKRLVDHSELLGQLPTSSRDFH